MTLCVISVKSVTVIHLTSVSVVCVQRQCLVSGDGDRTDTGCGDAGEDVGRGAEVKQQCVEHSTDTQTDRQTDIDTQTDISVVIQN